MLNTIIKNASFVFEHFDQAVIITDLDGKIAYWNPKAENIYGWNKKEVLGKQIMNILKNAEINDKRSDVWKQLQSGKGSNNNWILLRKDDSTVFVNSKTSLLFDKNGEKVGVMGISHEIDDHVEREDVLNFLSKAGELLSSSLDYKTSLSNITDLIVPQIADWFVIDIYNEEKNNFDMMICVHSDPEKVKWAYDLRKKYPVDMNAPSGAPVVLKTGKAELYREIPEDMIRAVAKDEEQLELLLKVGYHSAMILPLKGNNKIFGVMSLVLTTESNRRYEEFHMKMMEEFARKVALTIENVQLYREVKSAQERLNNIIDTIPCVVYETNGRLWDDRQQIVFVNDYLEKLLGYKPEEWMNTLNIGEKIVHPEDQEMVKEKLDLIKNSGARNGEMQYRALTKDGKVKWLESRFTILREDGKITGIRGVLTDIGLQKELENRKDEFIGIASHELKTPLASAKAYLQLLSYVNGQEDERQKFEQKAIGQLNMLNNIISDLLDISKIQAGKLEYKLADVSVNEIVEESVELIQNSNISHIIDVNGKLRSFVKGDKYRLQQVFNNILSNAVKYSPDAKKVDIELLEDDNEVKVKVQDYGVGIPSSHIPNIFEKFYRSDVNSEIASGLGIGLYITNEIVKRHNGRIEVDSIQGKGTTFNIILPRAL